MSALSADTRLRRARRTAARTIVGSTNVIVIDRQTMHTLNEVGTLVFERAQEAPLRELVEAVVEAFEVEPSVAEADVRAFVDEMLSLGVLEVVA